MELLNEAPRTCFVHNCGECLSTVKIETHLVMYKHGKKRAHTKFRAHFMGPLKGDETNKCKIQRFKI